MDGPIHFLLIPIRNDKATTALTFARKAPYTTDGSEWARAIVGSDRNALRTALQNEKGSPRIELNIVSAVGFTFQYTATGMNGKSPLQVMAALVDDNDRSSVRRGENAGRSF